MKSIIEEYWAFLCHVYTVSSMTTNIITIVGEENKNIMKDFKFFKPFSDHNCYFEWNIAVDLTSPWRRLALTF